MKIVDLCKEQKKLQNRIIFNYCLHLINASLHHKLYTKKIIFIFFRKKAIYNFYLKHLLLFKK